MPLLAGLLQALLMFLAFEPVAWWPLALLAPVPALWLAARPAGLRWKPAAAFGLGTLPFWLWHHLFIMDITGPGFVPLVLYLSAWPALAVWMLARVRPAWPRTPFWLLAPLVFTGLDMLRGEIVLSGYAWFLPGQPLIDSPVAAAGATVGIYGVGLLVLLFAAGLVRLTMPGRRAAGAWAIVLAGAAAAILHGAAAALRGDESGARSTRVAIVQTNVPQSNKLAWSGEDAVRDYLKLLKLTQSAAAAGAQLIIWPETMKFGWALTDAQIAQCEDLLVKHPELGSLRDKIATARLVRDLSQRLACPILVGQETCESPDYVEVGAGLFRLTYSARFNSAYLVRDGGVDPERYDKLEPTPFGENIPYASHWPWLRDKLTDLAAGGMKIDLASGTRRTVFNAGPGLRTVTPICFESTDTALCRSLVYDGGWGGGGGGGGEGGGGRRADLIACMTNDGWFGHSRSGRQQHLQLARWRCVELGTPMARAANTGLSAFIDADGRVARPDPAQGDRLGPDVFEKEGFLLGSIQTPTGSTLYGRIGNVAGWGSLAAAVMLWMPTIRRKKIGPAALSGAAPNPTPAAGPAGAPGGSA